jgi:hypothetical protein
MRAFEFLLEKAAAAPAPATSAPVGQSGLNPANLLGLKQDVLDMVNNLQAGKETRRILEKVKELLAVNKVADSLGAYASRVKDQGATDTDVAKAANQLTNLIAAAAEQTSLQDREFFFKKWEADQIVKVDKLLSGDQRYVVGDIFEYYGKSKAITFIVNALAKEAGYGLGKGELLLAVLSKRINKAPGKGDLIIDNKSIEVKTNDGGAPRFADQEVRVGAGYEKKRDEIIQAYAPQIEALGGLGKTGLNIDNYIGIGQSEGVDKAKFRADTAELVNRIFDGKVETSDLVDAIMNKKSGTSKKLFAEKTFQRYMDIKQDDAVLFINLKAKEPTYVMFKTVADLEKLGLYLHAKTIYILGMSGNRDVFPQMSINDSPSAESGDGAIPTAKPKQKVAKPVAPVAAPASDDLSTMKKNAGIKPPAPTGIAPSPNTTTMQGTSMVSVSKGQPAEV